MSVLLTDCPLIPRRGVDPNPYSETMENHASNPAGRLWLYFAEMSAKPANEAVSVHAARYFGTHGISARYMASMAGLMQLPEDVEAMVSQIQTPIPTAKLLRPLDAVRKYLHGDPLGSNAVSWMTSQIHVGVLSDLETTSHMLNAYVTPTSEIDEDTLEKIRSLASEILDLAMRDEELDADARAEFIRYAHRIAEAADLYKVTGPQALVDELDRFYQSARRMKSTPGRELWERTKQLTAVIVVAVELFTGPVNVQNAIEQYSDVFTLQEITQAPGPEVVDAEVVVDDGPTTA